MSHSNLGQFVAATTLGVAMVVVIVTTIVVRVLDVQTLWYDQSMYCKSMCAEARHHPERLPMPATATFKACLCLAQGDVRGH